MSVLEEILAGLEDLDPVIPPPEPIVLKEEIRVVELVHPRTQSVFRLGVDGPVIRIEADDKWVTIIRDDGSLERYGLNHVYKFWVRSELPKEAAEQTREEHIDSMLKEIQMKYPSLFEDDKLVVDEVA